ncbi:MAG: hypothetical protein EOO01_38980 [Chitinophagaceae bacterium]|nr:MAG: hypothetical protein EOO01_38980 [Chitinophagaceae bacterium]
MAAVFGASVILFWRRVNDAIRFFSAISYSLYLLHVPIGGKIINLGMRYTHSNESRYALVLFALGVSVIASYAFYKFVEMPAFRLSKKIRYPEQKVLADPSYKLSVIISTQPRNPTL